ncbi:MAG: hypothetical protein KAR44_00395 [Candidatus Aegiribacteria sp.]|nr:hypothetical protein [Candidatus Aegiribacteria sp.]
MKNVVFLLLCVALTLSAADRVVESGSITSPSAKGTYTVVSSSDPDMPGSTYGMALQDNVADRLWLACWGDGYTYEFDMSTGFLTGNSWEITNGIDGDDMAWCEYSGGAQFFIGDYTFSNIGVWDASGSWVRALAGPASFTNVFPVAAGNDMFYTDRSGEMAWGSYTGTESSITWTVVTSPVPSSYGMAVWGDFLFLCNGEVGTDNIFIFDLNPDGSVNLTPVWSTEFTEDADGANGGIDYDGTYLYVYPQNDLVYTLDIDWTSALENSTWGQIKAEF